MRGTMNGAPIVVVASVRFVIIGIGLVPRKMRGKWCLLSTVA